MKEQTERKYTRQELADYLEKLASELRAGEVTLEAESRRVPPEVDVKVRCKEKKGRYRCKIAWSWSSLGDYDQAAKEEVVRWAAGFKQVKKNLSGSFKRLKQSVSRGVLPDEGALRDFRAHARAFADLADPDWEQEAREFMDHLENLFRAFDSGRLDLISHEINDLGNRMAACHRDFA